jgi:cytochrome c
MLEYGTGWFQGNDDARLIRIEYNGGNRKPVAEIAADKPAGAKPLTVQLSSAGTKDYDSDPLTYEWKIALKAGGGTPLLFKEANPKLTLKTAGVYTATLTVKDGKGESATRSLDLVVGNEPPKLDFNLTKGNKTFFFPNKDIAYNVAVTDKEDGSIANGKIDPTEVAVSIDYLPEGYDKVAIAQGHRSADQNSRFARAIKLIDGTDCKACHKSAEKSIGPSFRDIALRYRGQADATTVLATRVINGSSGIWGQTAMAAHPALSKDDAEVIVRYILRHEDAAAVPLSLPAEGTFTTTVPSRGDKGVGVYILRAAYKDHGVKGLPALSSEQTYVLRNPNVDMAEIDDMKGVMKMKFGGNNLAIVQESGAHVGFKQVDLTGIVEIGVRASAPVQMNAAGGIIEIHLDSPTGALLGTSPTIGTAEVSTSGFAPPPPLAVKITPTTGVHDLYLVAKNPKAEAGKSLFVLLGLSYNAEFTPAAATKTIAAPAAGNALDQYAGKYKMTGLPFENIEISVKEGKLQITAGDQTGEITALPEPDKFDAAGQATIQFVRDNQGKVTQVKLIASGFSFDGQKIMP